MSMKDVAVLAGVSVGTVSNVLNRPEIVSVETRQRVAAAIAKLDWVPNETARQLRAGRSRSVGLILMDIANPFFTDLAHGVEEVAGASGYTVLLANSGLSAARQARHLDAMRQQRVRGVVVAPVGEDLAIEPLIRLGIPVVLADRHGGRQVTCDVSVDDFAGGQIAAEHLLGQGHRRLAVAGGSSVVRQIRDRWDGFNRGVLLGNPKIPKPLAIATETLDIAAGGEAAERIAHMDAETRPTAVFTANDLVAIGLLQGLMTRGIRVPEDISIIGYDDIQFAAAAAVPLSSIMQPRVELGRRAAELLLAEIDAIEANTEHRHEHPRFLPELVVRTSTNGGQLTTRRPPETAAVAV